MLNNRLSGKHSSASSEASTSSHSLEFSARATKTLLDSITRDCYWNFMGK